MPISTWTKIKENLPFIISILVFSWGLAAASFTAYHHYYLFPLLKENAELRQQAIGHQVLNWTAAKFVESYRAIPNRKPHQQEKYEYYLDHKNYFRAKVDEASNQGLTVELAPLE